MHLTDKCLIEILEQDLMPPPVQKRGDLFDKTDLIKVSPKSDGCQFISPLDYSMRTTSFMHGADMFPGLIAGLNNYAKEKNITLGDIKKLKFKKKTYGDLIYNIFDKKDSILERQSNVYGEFSDDKGNIHYFYGQDLEDRRPRKICANYLLGALLNGPTPDSNALALFEERVVEPGDIIDIPLRNTLEGRFKHIFHAYEEKLAANHGYVLATILDMVNLISQGSEKGSGVVMGYENIHISPQFKEQDLLDGSCHMLVKKVGKPRNVGENEYIFFRDFDLIKGEESLVHGSATLLKR